MDTYISYTMAERIVCCLLPRSSTRTCYFCTILETGNQLQGPDLRAVCPSGRCPYPSPRIHIYIYIYIQIYIYTYIYVCAYIYIYVYI